MRIAIIDRGKEIPAIKYGGTERVIWGLGYELAQLGHQVVFIVPKGSKCEWAEIINYDPEVDINSLIPENTDIVHMHFRPVTEPKVPYLLTMHSNYPNDNLPINTVFISKNHAERFHSETYVYNGLLWSDYSNIDLDKKREHLHFLGKASWRIKNLAGASEKAIKSGNKLKVLGGKRWKMYNLKRNPLYTLHPKVSYCGMADNKKKMEIMEQSKGLLFPVKWDEPFGLAIIESLYAGCPVFGSKRGSIPELVPPSVGFTSNNREELINAIKTKSFDPYVCHEYASTNFSAKLMTENYLKLYERILKGETLNQSLPYMDEE